MGWRDVQRKVESGALSFAPTAMDSFAATFNASFTKYYTDALDKQTDLLADQKELDAENKLHQAAAKRLWGEMFPDDPNNPNGVAYAYRMIKDYDGNIGHATDRMEVLKEQNRIDIKAPPQKNYFLSALDPNGVFKEAESGSGGYDALFSQAQNTAFSDVKLTEMTMADVLEFSSARGEGSYHDWVKKNLPPETDRSYESYGRPGSQRHQVEEKRRRRRRWRRRRVGG